MDKNTLVGFILIGAVIVGFGIYNRPSQEERARAQHYQDSIQQVIKQQEEAQEKQAAAAIEAARPDSTSLFFQAAQGTEQFTVLENDLVQLTFSNKGGRVSKALLKEYKDQKKQPLVLFDGEDASMNFGFEGKNENILSQQMYFEATNVTDSTVTMRLNAANGGHLDFNYRLLPNSYMVAEFLLSFYQEHEHRMETACPPDGERLQLRTALHVIDLQTGGRQFRLLERNKG